MPIGAGGFHILNCQDEPSIVVSSILTIDPENFQLDISLIYDRLLPSRGGRLLVEYIVWHIFLPSSLNRKALASIRVGAFEGFVQHNFR